MDTKIETAQPAGNGFRTLEIEPIEPPRIDLFGILLTLLSHKVFIAVMMLAGALLAGASALRKRPVYTAIAVILPPPQQRPALATFLGQMAPVSQPVIGGDLMRPPSDIYIGLLRSRSVADGIVQSEHLIGYYAVRNLTRARQGLAGRTRFESGKDTLIRISVRDRDPKKAASIANAYIDQLYRLLSRFAIAESAQRRSLYEKELDSERAELAAAEAAMRTIQERTGMLQVNSQVDAVIRSLAQLRAEITSREVMLAGLQSGATDQNPEVVRLRAELGSLRERSRRLESSQSAGQQTTPLLPAGSLPGAGLEYMRALRQLRYHESLYEMLAKQHEAARIDEAKQAAVVQVVDYAIPPEVKSGPRRKLLVLLGAISMGVLAAGYVLIRKRLSEEEDAGRVRILARALCSFK